ncbi:MAG TPA: hypothetical protein VND45_14215 [Thermoanaerobaculia bacterium]|nr:hypothetical protein [Thermoanaerobaculia bacterium]
MFSPSAEGGRRSIPPRRAEARRSTCAETWRVLLAFAGTGCYIYYNTSVLNELTTQKDDERLQAEAEKKYKKFAKMDRPRITAVQADVDIHPERRAVDIRGTYTMVNKSGKPLTELHVSLNPRSLSRWRIDLPGAKLKSDDRQLGYMIYELAQPLAPGASMPMRFDIGFAAKGFVNGESNTRIAENGTFFDSLSYFPHLGYNDRLELQDRGKRRKYGLGEVQRQAPPSDIRARMSNGLTDESDWISLDTTVSTSGDQFALAPGYLQRQWTQNGRRYFQYKTTSPILGFWSYLSARYAVKRDAWHGIPIEVYYDPKHAYNVDGMITR